MSVKSQYVDRRGADPASTVRIPAGTIPTSMISASRILHSFCGGYFIEHLSFYDDTKILPRRMARDILKNFALAFNYFDISA